MQKNTYIDDKKMADFKGTDVDDDRLSNIETFPDYSLDLTLIMTKFKLRTIVIIKLISMLYEKKRIRRPPCT